MTLIFPRALLLFIVMASAASSAAAESFYVDALNGNDARSGRSPAQSWQSLAKVNSVVFKPGDVVSFRSGQQWIGSLMPHGSGSPGKIITFQAYGRGSRPRIVWNNQSEQIVKLLNVEFITLQGLELMCPHAGACAAQRGVEVVLDGFGVAHGIRLRDLYVHDIRGSLVYKNTGGIVVRTLKGSRPSRYDGLEIAGNIVTHVDRSGIVFDSAFTDRPNWFPSTGVRIGENYLEDIGGDGIVPWASSNAIVEWNVLRRAGMRSPDYNAGIWPWSSDDTELRWNDVSGMGTTKDGEGFDSDFNSKNTLFEKNYSHDNQGGMMLICNPGDYDPRTSAGNTGTRVIRNVSHNDKQRVFNISGGTDVLIRDNLVIKSDNNPSQLVIFTKWNGWADQVRIVHNRFLVRGEVTSGHEVIRKDDGTYLIAPGWGEATGVFMEGNAYPVDAKVSSTEAHHDTSDWDGLESLDWQGPTFRPDQGDSLVVFMQKHRKWLLTLFRRANVD